MTDRRAFSELNHPSKQKSTTGFHHSKLSTSVHEKFVNFADDETSSTHSGSVHIDIDYLNKSLEHVNNFSKRRQTDKLPPVLMY
jgi:hypothetical protein